MQKLLYMNAGSSQVMVQNHVPQTSYIRWRTNWSKAYPKLEPERYTHTYIYIWTPSFILFITLTGIQLTSTIVTICTSSYNQNQMLREQIEKLKGEVKLLCIQFYLIYVCLQLFLENADIYNIHSISFLACIINHDDQEKSLLEQNAKLMEKVIISSFFVLLNHKLQGC